MCVWEKQVIDHEKQPHHGTHQHLATTAHLNSQSTSPFLGRNGHHQRALQALIVAHKVALAARLGALWEPSVLLDRLPLLRDELQRRRAVLHRARFDEPAADDEARAPNPAAAVHGGDAAPSLVVLQHVQDLPYVADRAGQAAVWDGEGVVLDLFFALLVDAETGDVRGEVRCVRG